jgi:N6-adenosine-specific RNA methylase IME4
VKTTISGEPVTSLDGLWRKPYEILLLGRAPGSRLEAVRNLEEEEVVQRVIFGVPDLHSRKPCLKEIIEGLSIIEKRGMVLEVFARCCIAGWWSWGNEVLKFAWDGYWDENENKEEI